MVAVTGNVLFYHVHPAPPPTVNNLTLRQKAQLRRSNNKLTKVLGAAPQVVDDYPLKVSRPLPLTPTKKLQPSLSISSGKSSHKKSRSAGERVDPELYPLSSSPRPASHDGLLRRSLDSKTKSRTGARSAQACSRSFSLEWELLTEDDSCSPVRPRPRPQKENQDESRPESFSRDSLCDSLYEPKFVIPSATKLRREKMARVCKLLGEDVPVDLVFPVADDEVLSKPEDNVNVVPVPVLDICAPQKVETAPLPPPKPRRKPVPRLFPDAEQPRWPTSHAQYCTPPLLETIVEQSPRASYSSSTSSSADSAYSVLTTTTSSSYRFSSSGCLSDESSPAPSSAHESSIGTAVGTSAPLISQSQQIREMSSGTQGHGRREFAIYVPFRRRVHKGSCQAEFEKDPGQAFDMVHSMLDLRV